MKISHTTAELTVRHPSHFHIISMKTRAHKQSRHCPRLWMGEVWLSTTVNDWFLVWHDCDWLWVIFVSTNNGFSLNKTDGRTRDLSLEERDTGTNIHINGMYNQCRPTWQNIPSGRNDQLCGHTAKKYWCAIVMSVHSSTGRLGVIVRIDERVQRQQRFYTRRFFCPYLFPEFRQCHSSMCILLPAYPQLPVYDVWFVDICQIPPTVVRQHYFESTDFIQGGTRIRQIEFTVINCHAW